MNNGKRKFLRCVVRKWLLNSKWKGRRTTLYILRKKIVVKLRKEKGFIIFVTCNVMVEQRYNIKRPRNDGGMSNHSVLYMEL